MDQKSKTELEKALICADCGLPLRDGRARTDVTRYLSEISRCSCGRQDGVLSSEPDSGKPFLEAVAVKVSFSMEEAAEILGENFFVLAFLGQGGMGSVFKVEDKRTSKVFAVKLLNPDLVGDEKSLKRFEQEAKAAMLLTHANLTAVYEYGVGRGGVPYLLMDFLEGVTLDYLLKKESFLDPRRALDIFIQIAEALEYAHQMGVVHRDIKPGNIMISSLNGIETAKLFDFGIAKAMPEQAIDLTQEVTQTGELYGSPLYMSPEQCRGLPVDPRSDIYAFACLMYKSLSGTHPFEGKNFVDTVVNIVTREPLALTASCRIPLPADLDRLIVACLSKEPHSRYQSASQLKLDLERIRDGLPIIYAPKLQSQKKSGGGSRSLPYFFVAAVASLLLIAGVVVYGLGHSGLRPQSQALDPYSDAADFDNKAFSYFTQGKYEQAIPLLQFGINTYKENGSKRVGANGREDNYLAENYSHLGKCYLKLGRYAEAVPAYKESLRMFRRWGNYPGGMMGEAVQDYAEVLRGLGRNQEAENMLSEFRRLNNLDKIP